MFLFGMQPDTAYLGCNWAYRYVLSENSPQNWPLLPKKLLVQQPTLPAPITPKTQNPPRNHAHYLIVIKVLFESMFSMSSCVCNVIFCSCAVKSVQLDQPSPGRSSPMTFLVTTSPVQCIFVIPCPTKFEAGCIGFASDILCVWSTVRFLSGEEL